jgi:hypothetical protein
MFSRRWRGSFFFRHSRASGNPVKYRAVSLGPRFRGDDGEMKLSKILANRVARMKIALILAALVFDA